MRIWVIMLNSSIIRCGCNCLSNEGNGYKMSPFGRKAFTSSASLRATRSKVNMASQPDALQLKQNHFREISGVRWSLSLI